LVGFEVHASNESLDPIDAFNDVVEVGPSVSRRQGLPLEVLASEPAPSSSRPKKDRPLR
jgi:hypothetical protein